MKFTTAIKHNGLLQKIPGTNYWQVKESFKWQVIYGDKKTEIKVNKGFITDFGSIPIFLRFLFNPTKYIAYVLHDFLYSNRILINGRLLTRKDKDLILLESLGVEGAWLITRTTIYSGVRIGGGSHYNLK